MREKLANAIMISHVRSSPCVLCPAAEMFSHVRERFKREMIGNL